ncbi:MAG: ROK family protein [Candidatus Gastranaerophilales bacterium]|nr:ROK family protein [Candidatus Gastranaerophilales bacterium]
MGKYAIGVDLGGTKILAGVIDLKTGSVIGYSKKRTKKDRGSEIIVKKIIETIEKALFETDIKLADIDSIGIGAAGQVDRENGILIAAPNLDCYDVNLKQILEKEFNLPVYVGNDVEVATIGEMKFGSGQGFDNFVCVFVGTGIGSGIVLNGNIYNGATGTAGEIGHIIVETGGRHCGCGGAGCLEAYASRTAIEKRIKAYIKKGHKTIITKFLEEEATIRSKHLNKAVKEKDEVVQSCIDEAAGYLSSGLASVVNFYNPELIILGGGLIEAIDYFYDVATRKTVLKSLPTPAKGIKFAKARLGDFSGIIGAAMLKKYREK